MWPFKTKEQKVMDLEDELHSFQEENKEYFNSYCFDGENVVIYKEVAIKNNRVVLYFIDTNTPSGYESFMPVWVFEVKYGMGFMKKHRSNFIRIKDQMIKLGLSVTN